MSTQQTKDAKVKIEKLELTKETVKNLNQSEAKRVQGGGLPPTQQDPLSKGACCAAAPHPTGTRA